MVAIEVFRIDEILKAEVPILTLGGAVFKKESDLKLRRTEQDFAAFKDVVIANEAPETRWKIVADNLNIHLSESVVRLVARQSGLACDLGDKGKHGILQSRPAARPSCATKVTTSPSPSPPGNASWLNQIEIWFSILARKVIRRGIFTSTEDLKTKIQAFIS